MKDKSSKW